MMRSNTLSFWRMHPVRTQRVIVMWNTAYTRAGVCVCVSGLGLETFRPVVIL